MARTTKAAIYAKHGVKFENGKIYAPELGWIQPLLKDGNDKVGRPVKTFSLLPTNKTFTIDLPGIHGTFTATLQGTCPCHCPGCYATTGRYNCPSVLQSLAANTYLCYFHLDFVKLAIMAQIEADKVNDLRIHAAGDFYSLEYVDMWHDIKVMYKAMVAWTYTKVADYECKFNDLENANIVKSIIPGYGLNYGHCDHIMNTYAALKAAGEDVYICRCGVDKNQHCYNCTGCSQHKYVLFLEHSTDYDSKKDPLFPAFVELVESQAAAVR